MQFLVSDCSICTINGVSDIFKSFGVVCIYL